MKNAMRGSPADAPWKTHAHLQSVYSTIYPIKMKTQFLKSITFCLVLLSTMLATSCREDELLSEALTTEKNLDSTRSAKFGVPTTFDQHEFALKIESYMEPLVAGFGYTIYNDGVPYYETKGGDGYARKHVDTPMRLHSALAKQEISTVTQYVTAVAMLHALQKYNVPVNAAVWPYLPKYWTISKDFKAVTFERLLAHRSGLVDYHDYKKLSLTVGGMLDKNAFDKNDRVNSDVNYLLLGVILPYLEAKKLAAQGNTTKLNKLESVNNNFIEYGEQYRAYVRSNVFKAAGLANSSVIDWRGWNENGTIPSAATNMGYPTKNGSEPGIPKELHLVDCGVTGLYMNAEEFAKFQSAVAQFKVISFDHLNLMKSKLLGFDGSIAGSKSIYYWKKGAENNSEAMIMDFGKVQVAVFATSTHSQITDPKILAQFYETSFKNL
jgi:CubicO group peptidase (beta-lactamase class C family)